MESPHRGERPGATARAEPGAFTVLLEGELDPARDPSDERAPLPLDGIFFATLGEQLVGAACTFLRTDDVAELGWVVVQPAHRGQGLGLQVCRAVLCFARDLGYRYVYLLTEDYRLPAIRLYLRLGFERERVNPNHPAWWAALRGPSQVQ